MRKKIVAFLMFVVLALMCVPSVAMASDITNAQWRSIVTVFNNGTAATEIAGTFIRSTPVLVEGGYLNTSANNCAMRSTSGADLYFMPGANSTNPWCYFLDSMEANSIRSLLLFLADTTGGQIRYFPGAAGMNTSDNADLELGDNFTIAQSIYFDATIADYLFYKENALHIEGDGAGGITATIGSDPTWTTPTGHDDPDAVWSNDTNAYDDDEVGSFAVQNNVPTSDWSGQLVLTHASLPVSQIRAKIYLLTAPAGSKVEVGVYDGSWHTIVTDTSPDLSGLVWNTYETLYMNVTQYRIRVYNGDAGSTRDARIYETDFGEGGASVSAADVASGEVEIEVSLIPCTPDTSEYFEWGNDGDSLATSGGDVTWTVPVSGTSVADIDTAQHYDGTRAGRLYRDGANNATAYFTTSFLEETERLAIPIRKDDNAILYIKHGNGVKRIYLSISSDEGIYYYDDGGGNDTGSSVTVNTWHIMEVGNVDWASGTYDIYMDDVVIKESASMQTNVGSNGKVWFDNVAGTSEAWIDGIKIYPPELTISIDGEVQGYYSNYSGVAIPDNDNDIVSFLDYVAPWAEYQKIWIDGVLQQSIYWEYGTTLTDLSGNSHDATPSFRTSSSDADVTASMTYFGPVSEAKAPAYVLEEAPAWIDDAIATEITSDFSTTPDDGGFPLAGVIKAVADATSTPAQLPLLTIAGFVIIAFSLSFTYAARKYGSGTIFGKGLVIIAVMGIFVAIGNFGVDFWMIVVYGIFWIALCMASRQFGW